MVSIADFRPRKGGAGSGGQAGDRRASGSPRRPVRKPGAMGLGARILPVAPANTLPVGKVVLDLQRRAQKKRVRVPSAKLELRERGGPGSRRCHHSANPEK